MNEFVEMLKIQIKNYRLMEKNAPIGSTARRSAKITADQSVLALAEQLLQSAITENKNGN